MREFTITQRDDGRKLEKWLPTVAPELNFALTRKYVRLKRVRINGKPAKEGASLSRGDVVQIYLNDELFEKKPKENRLLASFRPRIDVLYEDENILLIDKRPGLRVHPDDEEKVDTLVTHVQAYLYQKGEYDGEGFAPALCNRIDRFTGGIVIAAKNEEALRIMDRKVRNREIAKFYLCAAAGRLSPQSGALKGYLLKEGKRVKVLHKDAPGAQYAETRYRTISCEGDVSLVECELVTGRTHQIRAQFADARHPLIGDTQYGDPEINRAHDSNFQQLYAYRLEFRFTTESGILDYLNGKTFRVKRLHRGFDEIDRRAEGEDVGLEPARAPRREFPKTPREPKRESVAPNRKPAYRSAEISDTESKPQSRAFKGEKPAFRSREAMQIDFAPKGEKPAYRDREDFAPNPRGTARDRLQAARHPGQFRPSDPKKGIKPSGKRPNGDKTK